MSKRQEGTSMFPWPALACLAALASPALGACPCVSGGLWKYDGGTYSFCANPNNARTSWCPKALNADGTYTSDLPMAWCEGAEFTECQALKEENAPACPCVEGGDWGYKGQPQSYCSDPTNAGFTWCATGVNKQGNYESDYAICNEAVKDSCDALKEAKPLPDCPCLPGGQWSFDGERQSYCQQPIGRAAWCPTSVASVTKESMGSVEMKYCEGRVLDACTSLEGTRVPTTCPCVEGGQWQHKGQQYSYCEEKNWCATEVDDAGVYQPGKFAKCKGAKKVACHAQHVLRSQAGKDLQFSQYTQANTGCPCWFDLTRSDCACCTDEGVQCGAPLQGYCTAKSLGRQSGCLGLPSSHWTLSTQGYPCFFNTTRTDCGWCATGGAQCGEGPRQGHCRDPEDSSYCTATQGDCLRIDKCDSEATCQFDVKFGKSHEHHSCRCNTGWTGNGLQCYDASGAASPEMMGTSSGDVSLTMAVTNKYYVYPHNSSQFPTVPGEEELLNNINALFEAGATCGDRKGCNGTFVSLVETPGNP